MFFYIEQNPNIPLTLSVDNSSINFLNTYIGETRQQTFTVSTSAGNVIETITLTDNTDEYSFSPSSFQLSATSSQLVTVSFTPTSWGVKTGSISISSTSGSTVSVDLIATCVANPLIITSSVQTLDFASGYVQETSSASFTVSAGGAVQDIVLLSDNSDQFDFSPTSFSMTGANQTQNVTVYFTPTSSGSKVGILTLSASGGDVAHLSLTGSGAYRPLVLTSSINSITFNRTLLNNVSSSTFTISAGGIGGTETVTLSDNSNQFNFSPASFSLTGGGESRIITASFTPTLTGTLTGTLTLSSSGGSTRSVTMSGIGESDIYYQSVSLLLKGNSSPITDSSINNVSITAYDNAAVSAVQSKYGGSSIYFDGNNDYLSIPSSTNFDFGAGNFTIEMWINPSSVASGITKHLFGKRSSAAAYNNMLSVMASNGSKYNLSFYGSVIPTSWTISYTSGYIIDPNVWTHIAFVRNGSEFLMFINGTKVSMPGNSSALTFDSSDFTIGSAAATSPGTAGFIGYIDDFRVTKGVARYTANFTPPGAL